MALSSGLSVSERQQIQQSASRPAVPNCAGRRGRTVRRGHRSAVVRQPQDRHPVAPAFLATTLGRSKWRKLPISTCKGEVSEQRCRPNVKCRVSISARLLGQGRRDGALADASWTLRRRCSRGFHPARFLSQRPNDALVQSAGSAIVDVLDASVAPQLGARGCRNHSLAGIYRIQLFNFILRYSTDEF